MKGVVHMVSQVSFLTGKSNNQLFWFEVFACSVYYVWAAWSPELLNTGLYTTHINHACPVIVGIDATSQNKQSNTQHLMASQAIY